MNEPLWSDEKIRGECLYFPVVEGGWTTEPYLPLEVAIQMRDEYEGRERMNDPLWSDNRIRVVSHLVIYFDPDDLVVSADMMLLMRNEYEEKLAEMQARITELEEQLEAMKNLALVHHD